MTQLRGAFRSPLNIYKDGAFAKAKPATKYSKITKETLELGVKYV